MVGMVVVAGVGNCNVVNVVMVMAVFVRVDILLFYECYSKVCAV